MDHTVMTRCTAFEGYRRLASGGLGDVALAVKAATNTAGPVLVFDDRTGRVVDLDLRGTDAEVLARFAPAVPDSESVEEGPRPRGRPKLGVVAREVTLLPRHWEWLNQQPGGASVALRKLVEQARRDGGDKDTRQAARDAAYRFMAAMAGDFPGFEEASRALFAGDRDRLTDLIQGWPSDVRDHINSMLDDGRTFLSA